MPDFIRLLLRSERLVEVGGDDHIEAKATLAARQVLAGYWTAMSQENVELARLAYERYNRGDIDGFLELCEPDFEFRDVPSVPGSGVYIGHDGYRRWHRGMLDVFEDLRFEGVEFIDGGDQVVVAAQGVATGKGSGASVEIDYSNVFTIKDGRIVSLTSYTTHADALEAVGLRE